jgi:hypothetical protein
VLLTDERQDLPATGSGNLGKWGSWYKWRSNSRKQFSRQYFRRPSWIYRQYQSRRKSIR